MTQSCGCSTISIFRQQAAFVSKFRDEGSLLPKYRDCTISYDFELYSMCCGLMLLLLTMYIYIYVYIISTRYTSGSCTGMEE